MMCVCCVCVDQVSVHVSDGDYDAHEVYVDGCLLCIVSVNDEKDDCVDDGNHDKKIQIDLCDWLENCWFVNNGSF